MQHRPTGVAGAAAPVEKPPVLSATEIVRARWPSLPLIVVSGSLGEELIVDLFKNGVKDCISKGHLSRLAPSVRRVMQDVKR